jgi:hypothetical protein
VPQEIDWPVVNIKENEDELKVKDISTAEGTNSQYICKE